MLQRNYSALILSNFVSVMFSQEQSFYNNAVDLELPGNTFILAHLFVKGPFQSSSHATTCYYQFNRSKQDSHGHEKS